MTIDRALTLVDNIIRDRTGKNLSDLQVTILREVWHKKKYIEIADSYGCTEGHAKDTAYLLWKTLSQVWGEKVTKKNFQTIVKKYLKLAVFPLKNTVNTIAKTPKKQQDDISFIGRERAVEDLDGLVNRGFKIIVIQGRGGIGKTTLAKKYLVDPGFDLVLEFLMAKETKNITSVESLVEEWLKRDFQDEPAKEFGVTLARLKRHLVKRKVGILIDNLEPALNKYGQLIKEQRNYIELLRILADSSIKSVTLVTSRDRFCEGDLDLYHYRLSGLSIDSWSKFFTINGVPVSNSIVKKIHRIYGGNAKAMGILCGVISSDFASDINAYWQENNNDPLVEIDLKNLVTNQFDRLQKLDPQAYLLLCRLGCFLYQDVPYLSKAGLLALLWDVDTNKNIIIESLRNRSLVEFDRGNYWLHPVIKAEALSRLDSTEWQQVNRQIALFYTESITQINTIEEGLIALEAYYHYVAISDFTAAGKTILYSRSNKWGQHLTLGTNLYRLGLSQPLLKAITTVIEQIKEAKIHSELNNILGDLYWISGNIKQAIACQESTIKKASNYLNKITVAPYNKQNIYYWKMLQVDSLLSIGLYQIDLWELELAKTFFQQVIALSENTNHHSWSEKAAICLALVNSYLGNKEKALVTTTHFVQLINKDLEQIYNAGRFAYFIQILGQTLVNLQQYELAENLLLKAIAFSQESHYVQIKAKAITSLAIIQREQNNFSQADLYHLQSIGLLEKIGAKCDLAEAYYQRALTLQRNHQSEDRANFEKAIKLFTSIDAPQQISKVTQNLS